MLQHGPACKQVYCLGWDCEGQKLASASIDKTVRVWNIEARHKVLFHEHKGNPRPAQQIMCLACLPLR